MLKTLLVAVVALLLSAVIFATTGPLDTRPLAAELAGTSLLTLGGACTALGIMALITDRIFTSPEKRQKNE